MKEEKEERMNLYRQNFIIEYVCILLSKCLKNSKIKMNIIPKIWQISNTRERE
jgi:hypothetical protein